MAECKYYKLVRQVSYDSGVTWISLDEYQKGDLYENDSPDCGGGITQYKWVNVSGEYTCAGTTKYQKTKKQQSTDGGQTWTDVNPPEYSTGAVIERESSDCQTSPYAEEYLTFVARESVTFHFDTYLSANTIQYSIDNGSTWSTLGRTYNPAGMYIGNNTPTIQSGQKIMWKGNMNSGVISWRDYGIGQFFSSGLFEVEGNIMSLLYGDNFRGQTSLSGKDYVFLELFSTFDSGSRLTSIEGLVLPATTLSMYCYYGMFAYCTSLTTIPSGFLPARALEQSCYAEMFKGCSNLATVASDSLQATTLATTCCHTMFSGCTSLTTAPDLLATTLQNQCYQGMFSDCTSLNYVKCLATNISAYEPTYQWLSNVSSSGTFVKASSTNWGDCGVSSIPCNWTIQNA